MKDLKINSFEDLIIWQKSVQLFVDIANDIKSLPREAASSIIINQILRSSSSISANIAEGFGRYKGKEFQRYLKVSRGSVAETQDWLIKKNKLNYITKEKYKIRREQSNEIIKC